MTGSISGVGGNFTPLHLSAPPFKVESDVSESVASLWETHGRFTSRHPLVPPLDLGKAAWSNDVNAPVTPSRNSNGGDVSPPVEMGSQTPGPAVSQACIGERPKIVKSHLGSEERENGRPDGERESNFDGVSWVESPRSNAATAEGIRGSSDPTTMPTSGVEGSFLRIFPKDGVSS